MPRPAALLLALAAAPAAAGPFDGVWAPDAAACEAMHHPDRGRIGGDELSFYEETCRLGPGTPAASPEGAMVYAAQCHGFDEDLVRRIALHLLPDGRLLIAWLDDGAQDVEVRCD